MQVKDPNRNRKNIMVVALICAVLHLALAPHVHILDGAVNFCLIGAAVLALSIGGSQTVIAGFLFGLVYDLSTTGPVGLMAFELCIASFVMGVEQRNRLSEDRAASIEMFALVCLAVELVYGIAMLLVGDAHSILQVLGLRVFPSVVLDLVAYGVVALLMRSSHSKATPTFGSLKSKGGSHFDIKGL